MSVCRPMSRWISKRVELQVLIQELGVRPDWHEPDEQGFLFVELHGESFDYTNPKSIDELHIVLSRDKEPEEIRINLAMLLAWAGGFNLETDNLVCVCPLNSLEHSQNCPLHGQLIRQVYDPTYGDKKVCQCGHAYYRHFDTYEKMLHVGCKYCSCFAFTPSEIQ